MVEYGSDIYFSFRFVARFPEGGACVFQARDQPKCVHGVSISNAPLQMVT